LVGRDAQVPEIGAMSGPGSAVFTLNKGTISEPINLGRAGVVLSVVEKQEPTAEDIAKNFDQTREQLLNDQREEIFRVYVGNVTKKYEESGAVRYSKKQEQPALPTGGN
jgi:peptidyl-prolyl cis-trans isomerase D